MGQSPPDHNRDRQVYLQVAISSVDSRLTASTSAGPQICSVSELLIVAHLAGLPRLLHTISVDTAIDRVIVSRTISLHAVVNPLGPFCMSSETLQETHHKLRGYLACTGVPLMLSAAGLLLSGPPPPAICSNFISFIPYPAN